MSMNESAGAGGIHTVIFIVCTPNTNPIPKELTEQYNITINASLVMQ